ncbi:PAS domain-containing methyl-accepting chemotaxis protein [Marinobacter sp. TBZ242]|uniref:PAS domain-containing methyl-accepting chemotaxis protein n=1 Tax=Marinobacter azerbaijanicus TaxID=3050455 RepID=A0ABT7IH53_9GAMM|nr:PAS domain-containing methyl-accepting chemotaxis protein [Marinobacter sp. TBZ242]MDL0433480.1 PAS domain-containing methyl-accepting chemotaxis protein [Marinobacter sp. TBZ242]
MRVNAPVTDREEPVRSEDRLISTTNLKGVIQSANESFCRVAGFSEEELIGKPHNIVRHPEMPEAVYENFWSTLKSGKPWMGIIKNRCKNGDYYWVSGFVSPVFEGTHHVGFQSVRTQATAEQKERASRLYARLRNGKPIVQPWNRVGTRGRLAVVVAVISAAGVAVGNATATLSLPSFVAIAGVAALIGAAITFAATRRLGYLTGLAQNIFGNTVGEYTYGGGHDIPAQVELAIAMQRAQMDAMQTRVYDLVEKLGTAIVDTEHAAQSSQEAIGKQREDTQGVATAMNEMATTAQEVSRNANDAATSAEEASRQASEGGQVMDEASRAMKQLASEIQEAAVAVQRLEKDTEEIRKVIGTVQSISEQTNLLALNAAIEAARAGEAGRGFSVVADEVRALSARVNDATGEISDAIERLEAGVGRTSDVMGSGTKAASEVGERAEKAHQTTQNIVAAVATITDMNTQIASAAEEQTQVAEEVSQAITSVNDGFATTDAAARKTRQASEQLSILVQQLSGLIRQFRVLGK